jgi:WD40 repeat protein
MMRKVAGQLLDLYMRLLTLALFLITLQTPLMQTDIWEIDPITRLTTDAELYDVKWSPNGEMLAVGGDWGVKMFDNNLQEITTLEPNTEIRSVAWRPDGSQLAAAGRVTGEDDNIKVWAVTGNNFNSIATLSNGYDAEFFIAWNPDGSKLASIEANLDPGGLIGRIQIWDTQLWTLETTIQEQYRRPMRALLWNSNTTIVFGGIFNCINELDLECPDSFEGGLYVADTTTGQVIKNIPLEVPDFASSIGFALNSEGSLVVPFTFFIYLFDETYQRTARFDITGGNVQRLDWSPDNQKIAYSVDSGLAGIIDTTTTARFEFLAAGRITGLDWHPDGDILATVSRTGVIELWGVSDLPDVSGIPTITPQPTPMPS